MLTKSMEIPTTYVTFCRPDTDFFKGNWKPKPPSPQVPKSPSPQVPKSPSPQVPKFPSPQVPKSASPHSTVLQVPKSPPYVLFPRSAKLSLIPKSPFQIPSSQVLKSYSAGVQMSPSPQGTSPEVPIPKSSKCTSHQPNPIHSPTSPQVPKSRV